MKAIKHVIMSNDCGGGDWKWLVIENLKEEDMKTLERYIEIVNFYGPDWHETIEYFDSIEEINDYLAQEQDEIDEDEYNFNEDDYNVVFKQMDDFQSEHMKIAVLQAFCRGCKETFEEVWEMKINQSTKYDR